MIDCFALFQEPRRPWLEPDTIKAKFLSCSSDCHPDRVHSATEAERIEAQQRYTELNAAYQCLRDPRERALHLLELESGRRPKATQAIAPDTMDLFMEVGALCRSVDAFLAEKSKVTSPLLKVQWFEKGMQWTEALNALRQKIMSRNREIMAELTGLNSDWELAPPVGDAQRGAALPLERLEHIYRVLSFSNRWLGQLDERAVQLSL